MKLTAATVRDLEHHAVNRRRDSALWLAESGLHVFPLVDGGKRPRVKDWENAATTDPVVIARWFDRWPTANYGVACGPSGLVVVDLDVKSAQDGPANWAHLVAEIDYEQGFRVETPSGGHHIYWRTEGLRNSAGTVAPGVDVRGEGGYVVGPGSEIGGKQYRASHGVGLPGRDEIPTASDGLRAVLSRRTVTEDALPERVPTAPDIPVRTRTDSLGASGQVIALLREVQQVIDAPAGERNDTLNRAAHNLGQIANDKHLPEDAVVAALTEAGHRAGLDDSEIRATIASGLSAGRANPRLVDDGSKAAGLYEPANLLEWFATEHPSPEHFGAGQVLYEGGLTWISGEPESGKSVLSYGWMLDLMRSGKRVVLLDEEAGPADALAKLIALGATPELLAERLLYLPPLGRDIQETAAAFHALINSGDVGLVVVDSSAAVLANAGLDEDRNAQVVQFVNRAILPISKQFGIATVVIDHKTKSNAESRYSRGASAKLGIVDLALNVVARQPFSKEDDGTLELIVMKDRWGDHGRGATWLVNVATGGGHLDLHFAKMSKEDAASKRPATKSEADGQVVDRVMSLVTSAGADGLSRTRIVEGLQGVGTDRARAAVKKAQDLGLIREGGKRVSGAWSLVAVANELAGGF